MNQVEVKPPVTVILIESFPFYFLIYFFNFYFIKGHKLNSLMASMKSSYRIHEHNSDNNDNKINFDK